MPTRTGAVAWLRHHPFPRYAVTGVLSLAVDLVALKLLHGEAGVPLVPATVAAYAAAFCVNFSLSRWWTFRATRSRPATAAIVRYTALVVANLAVTVAIVTGLVALGVYYLLAKVVAAVVIAGVTFVAARRWVFL